MNENVVNSSLGATAAMPFHKTNTSHQPVFVNLHNKFFHYTTTTNWYGPIL